MAEVSGLLPQQHIKNILQTAVHYLSESTAEKMLASVQRHKVAECPWNARFQSVVDNIHSLGPGTPLVQKIAANLELSQLSRGITSC